MAGLVLREAQEREIDAPVCSGQSKKVTKKRYVQMIVVAISDALPILRAGGVQRSLH